MDNTRNVYYPTGVTPARQVSTAPSALKMGGVGMIVGAAGSAAANIRRLNVGEIDKGKAATNVVRDSVGAGVATAAATGAVNMLGWTGLLSIAGLLATATATKYLYDTAFEPTPEPPALEEPPATKPAAKPKTKAAATKKTTRKRSTSTTGKKSINTTRSTTKKED